jgi:hypothetical protein
MSSKGKYHFIIGMPRAGTTLLSSELNKYEDVIGMPESKHVIRMLRSKDDYSLGLKKYYDVAFPKLKNKPYTVSDDIINVIAEANNKSIKQNSIALGKCFSFFETEKKANIFIDKNPMYTFHWEKITKEFIESKFVVMVRNPKAFANSKIQKKHHEERMTSPYYFSHVWNNFCNEIFAFKKKHPDNVMVVKYEDLVSDKNVFFDIVSFLEIETKKMEGIEFEENYKNLISEEMIDRHKTKYTDLSKPVNKDRINAFKDEMSEMMLARIESICSSNMLTLGYKKEYKKANNFALNIPYLLLGRLHKKRAKK